MIKKVLLGLAGLATTTIIIIGGLCNMADTELLLNPSSGIIVAGEEFAVAVEVNPGEAIAGYQFTLNYPPDMVEVLGVTEGDLFSGLQTYFQPGFILPGKIENIVGVIAQAGGGEVSNPGIAVTVLCRAKQTAGEIEFTISNVLVGNKLGVAVPVTFTPASVVVATSTDVDLSGSTDASDMLLVVAALGWAGVAGSRREDVKSDGKVDILDAILVGQNYD